MRWTRFFEQAARLTQTAFLEKYTCPALILKTFAIDGHALCNSKDTPERLPLPLQTKNVTRLDLLFNSQNWEDASIIFLNKKNIIGRNANNDIIIPVNEVSRHHATISQINCTGEHWVLTDYCSKNGTYIDGEKIHSGQPYSLEDECVIDFSKGVTSIYRTARGLWETVVLAKMLEQDLSYV